jgi:site-specific recombinase XerC
MSGDSSLAASEYGSWIGRSGLSTHTKRAYGRAARDFLAWLAAHPEHSEALSDPHSRDYAVRDYKRERLTGKATGRKMAPKSVQLDLTALQSFFGWLGLGAPEVKQVRIQRRDPQCLDEDEVRAILRSAERRGRRDLALVHTTLRTGVRLRELAALDLDDLELHARSGWLHVRAGKGDKPRTVPVPADTRQALGHWLAIRRDWAGADDPAVWLSRRGRRLAVSSIDFAFDEVGRAARVLREDGTEHPVPLSAHILRHTCTADLLRSGVDAVTVANILGHSDTKTITSVYGVPTRAVMTAAVEGVTYDY